MSVMAGLLRTRLGLALIVALACLAGSLLSLPLVAPLYEAVGVLELGDGFGVQSAATAARLASRPAVLRAAWEAEAPVRRPPFDFTAVQHGILIDTAPGNLLRVHVRHRDTQLASRVATQLTRELALSLPRLVGEGLATREARVVDALREARTRLAAASRAHENVRALTVTLQRDADREARLAIREETPGLQVAAPALRMAAERLASEAAALGETRRTDRRIVAGDQVRLTQESQLPLAHAPLEARSAVAVGDADAASSQVRAAMSVGASARERANVFYAAEAREQAAALELRLALSAVSELETELVSIDGEQGRLRSAVRVVQDAAPPSERLARQFLGHGVLAVALAGLCVLVAGSHVRGSVSELSGALPVGIVVAAFAAGIGATWLSETPTTSIPWAAFALALVLVLSLVLVFAVQGRLDPLSPPTLFVAIACAGYLLPLPSFLDDRDVISALWPHTFTDFDAAVGRALRLAALAVLGFFLGYAATPRLRWLDRVPRVTADARRIRWVGLGFTAVAGMLAVLLVLRIGGPGALVAALADRTRAFAGMGYLVWGLMLPGIFCLFWWESLLRARRPWHPWFLVFTPLAIGVSALTGSKANTFSLLLAGVAVYHVLYRPLSWRVMALAGVCGILGLALFELLVRDVLVRGWVHGDQDLIDVVWTSIQVALAGTFFQLQILSIVTDVFPERLLPQWGSSYLFLLAAPIPSSVWAAKPLPLAGLFTMTLWPSRFVDEGTTIPASLLGEFYVNFGWTGVLVGMGLFGFGYRIVRIAVERRPDVPGVPSIYGIALALMLHYVRGEVAPVTVIALLLAVPVSLAALLSMRRARSQEAVVAARG